MLDLMSIPERIKLEVTQGDLLAFAKCLLNGHSTIQKEEVFISIKEVCNLTGLAKQTIYGRVSKGTIPYYKAPDGKRLRFKKFEILEWLDSGRKNKSDADIEQEVEAYIKSKKIGKKSR